MKTFAFEGINASGKSHIIYNLVLRLHDYKYFVAKIGGLGENFKIDRLKKILTYREEKLRAGELNKKDIIDYKRDRIFRLAYKIQIKDLNNNIPKNLKYLILDRTPLMSWAYTSAVYKENPYIKEVREDAIEYTDKLKIMHIFLVEVQPSTVYARIISRHNKFDPLKYPIQLLIKNINAPENIKKEIYDKVNLIKDNSYLIPKKYAIWDYIDYDDVLSQLESYRNVISEAAKINKFTWSFLNGENSVDNNIKEIMSVMGEK